MAKKNAVSAKKKVSGKRTVKSGLRGGLRKMLMTLPKEDGNGPFAGFRGSELSKSLLLAGPRNESPCHLIFRVGQNEEVRRPLPKNHSLLAVDEEVAGDAGRLLIVRSGFDPDPQAYLAIVEDIADAYLGSSEGANSFVETVWKFIGRTATTPPFTYAVQAGLMGELAVLEDDLILALSMSRQQAITSWRGPYGAAKDFEFSRCFVEVKATKSSEDRSFWVSSEEQFLEPEEKPMFLCFVSFDGGREGETVANAVARIGEWFEPYPEAFAAFDDAVSAAGFKKRHRDAYELETFRFVKREYFQVDATFPRLRLENLRTLLRCHYVSEIDYSINVDHLNDLKVERQVVLEAMKEGSVELL